MPVEFIKESELMSVLVSLRATLKEHNHGRVPPLGINHYPFGIALMESITKVCCDEAPCCNEDPKEREVKIQTIKEVQDYISDLIPVKEEVNIKVSEYYFQVLTYLNEHVSTYQFHVHDGCNHFNDFQAHYACQFTYPSETELIFDSIIAALGQDTVFGDVNLTTS